MVRGQTGKAKDSVDWKTVGPRDEAIMTPCRGDTEE